MAPNATQLEDGRDRRLPLFYLGILVVLAAICYGSLARNYFAQDDFILLERAAFTPGSAVSGFFSNVPGQFRPLTKGAYFVITYRLFGLDAFPYHIIAMLLHAVNIVLVFSVLRRWSLSVAAALTGATLFAFHGAFFHVLAWIACVQQLLAMTFALTALILGHIAIDTGRRDAYWWAVAAYLCALLSFEQTAAIPGVLLLFTLRARGWSLRAALDVMRRSLALWMLMVVYLGMILLWKGLPDAGPYRFSVGGNIVANLVQYVEYAMALSMRLPSSLAGGQGITPVGTSVLAVLVSYHLWRRRWRDVVAGIVTFVAMLAPTLFLAGHAYPLHVYVPSIGVIYLFCRAADDLFAAGRFAGRDATRGALAALLLVIGAIGFYGTHVNATARLDEDRNFHRSFVIRRAETARRIIDALVGPARERPDVDAVYLVYARVGNEAGWNNANVKGSIGNGAAIRLLYGRGDLPVHFATVSDPPPENAGNVAVFLYDDLGNIRYRR